MLVILLIWERHLRFSEIVMPKYLLQYVFIQLVKVGRLAIDAHNVALLGVNSHSPSFGPNLKLL